MPVTERIRRQVWTQAAGTCSICRTKLLQPMASQGDIHFLGEIAHIVAEEPNGPRGTSHYSSAERNQEHNLMLLCMTHHKMIDDDPSSYTVERLKQIKAAHLSWVLGVLDIERPWATKLHNLHYINVPRLNMLAATAGISLNLGEYEDVEVLHLLRIKLGPLMAGFQSLLEKVELNAVPIELLMEVADPRGAIVSFNRDFRTKNVHMPQTLEEYRHAVSGDLSKDPHIYTKISAVRMVAKIDPRWITTSTAFCEFRPSSGKNKFAGLGVVQSGSSGSNEIVITPLVIGLPSNPFMEAFYGGL